MKTRVIKLKEIADIIMGQSPKSEYYNHDGKGIEFLQGTKTFGENVPYFDTFTTKYNKLSRNGDILFSVRAPVGEVNLADRDIAIGRGIAAIRAKNEIDKMYLYYWFKRFLRKIESSTSGTVFQSINKKDLENISMEIPDSLYIQRRIGNLLFSIDNKIQNNNEINDNLSILMINLFYKYVLTNKLSYGKIGDIADLKKGISYKSKFLDPNNENKDSKYFISLSNFNINGGFKFGKMKYYYGPYNESNIVEPGQLLIGATDVTQDRKILGAPILLPYLSKEMLYSLDIFKVSVNENIKYWLYMQMQTSTYRYKIANSATGTTVLRVSKKFIDNIDIQIPDDEQLYKFNLVFNPLIQLKEKIFKENIVLKKYRDKLINKLIH